MEDRKDWGPWLRRARRAQDWTQEQMARAAGIKRTTYANYEAGQSRAPDEIINRLVAKGVVPPDAGRDVASPRYPVAYLLVPIPKGPPVPCTDWSDPLDASYEDFEEVDPYMAGTGRFSCEILGDSMYDLLQPGDIAVFQAESNPKVGQIVIARNSENQATCKQLLHNGEHFVLHSLNNRYEDVTADYWLSIGYLIGIIRSAGSRRTTVFDPGGIRP